MTKQNIIILSLVALAIIVIIFLSNKKKDTGLERVSFDLPTSSSPNIFGPKYWSAFHTLAAKVPCPGCRVEAIEFMRFFHDYVNIRTGKELFYPENFADYKTKICNINDPA